MSHSLHMNAGLAVTVSDPPGTEPSEEKAHVFTPGSKADHSLEVTHCIRDA